MAHSADRPPIQRVALTEALDESGVLRPGALAEPAASFSLMVFSQGKDARVELAAWQKNAEAFFATRLRVGTAKRYPEGFPAIDAAWVEVSPRDEGLSGERACYGRPRTDSDLRAAEDADVRQGSAGLGLLARRCPTVWLVDREGEDDGVALLIATILASVLLGPIVSPEGEIFGVKTGRAKLATKTGPYR